MSDISLAQGDALLVIDVQNDFLPGGALGVAHGDEVLAPINRLITLFQSLQLPVVASRDWHPPNHCSFQPQGGPWPAHCVAGSDGAAFAAGLALPADAIIVSKAATAALDAYSAFGGTDLAARLHARGVQRVTVVGLATDYCVRATVADARDHGFAVLVLPEAMRAVEASPGDGERAMHAMRAAGARVVALDSAGLVAERDA